MTYPTGYPPQQQGPPPWTPPPPPPTPRARGGLTARLGLAATILAAALGGGITGALLTRADTPPPSDASPTTATRQTPTADEVHAQDVKLCTEYVLVVATKPQPVGSSRDLVPALAALRTSLAAYPDASPDLRSALNDVADSYFAQISDFESKGPQGLVNPPKYDQAASNATRDRAWALCGLK